MMTLIIPRKEAPVSGEGTVVIPQPAGDEPVIKNTFFFPDIDPKRVRERMRLEQTVAPARLREAIKSGMAEANAELYEYREQKIAAGFTRLADVPADDIDGESIKVFYYERAVCAMATASLYERYRGVDASAKGDKKADSIDSTIDELWRDMRWAVARIQDNAVHWMTSGRDALSEPFHAVAISGRPCRVPVTVSVSIHWKNWSPSGVPLAAYRLKRSKHHEEIIPFTDAERVAGADAGTVPDLPA